MLPIDTKYLNNSRQTTAIRIKKIVFEIPLPRNEICISVRIEGIPTSKNDYYLFFKINPIEKLVFIKRRLIRYKELHWQEQFSYESIDMSNKEKVGIKN